VAKIYAAPGNAGTARLAQNLDITPNDIEGLLKAAREKAVGLTIVGPEAPLAAGIVDRFQAEGLTIFGPTRAAAQIESSKIFTRELLAKYNIPGAAGASFTSYDKASRYLEGQKAPIVIKADGLAAGKGVVVAGSIPQARQALSDFMQSKTLGAAGDRIIIEECLIGREMSYFAFSDGANIAPMLPACDYKRAYDGGKGPNTGGMGSYCPPRFHTPALAEEINETIMKPTVAALASEGTPYKGVLYAGLMITNDGPKVMEFNARFGDPETQVVLPLLKTDLVEIMLASIEGRLAETEIAWSSQSCCGVVMASGDYPGSYRTGFDISGLDDLDDDIMVFHAGTRLADGRAVTSGGRVLAVTATGDTLAAARRQVYANLPRIDFEGCHYRKDIAQVKEG
jgi:phosphoribosylamine--glycine ligase